MEALEPKWWQQGEVRPAGQGSRQTRRYLAAYTQANQLADISVSADPFVAFPMANLIISKGVKVVRESDEALKKRSHAQVLTLSVRPVALKGTQYIHVCSFEAMSYSRGVLIYNFNEAAVLICATGQTLTSPRTVMEKIFNTLQGLRLESFVFVKRTAGPNISVSHTVHNWKTPANEKAEVPASGLDRHILFGHTGDMRDPHTNLQKTEFATANQYFLQDPAAIPGVGTITADGFTAGVCAFVPQNHFVAKMRAHWGDMRQCHALPPDERFLSETKKSFTLPARPGEAEKRNPRHYEEFTRQYDSVKVTRSPGLCRGSNLRSAASLMVQ
ncbi:unnamed protein product [Effrenium voratum]|nr:unnamed protein product [Effrenium voratum]